MMPASDDLHAQGPFLERLVFSLGAHGFWVQYSEATLGSAMETVRMNNGNVVKAQ